MNVERRRCRAQRGGTSGSAPTETNIYSATAGLTWRALNCTNPLLTFAQPSRVPWPGWYHLDSGEFERAYFIRADGSRWSTAKPRTWWMARQCGPWRSSSSCAGCRRASVGRRAAHAVIARHPRTWEVTETPNNGAAIAFWRKGARHRCVRGGRVQRSQVGPSPSSTGLDPLTSKVTGRLRALAGRSGRSGWEPPQCRRRCVLCWPINGYLAR